MPQLAPPVLDVRTREKLPYPVSFGSDAEAQEIAAEVVAILSKNKPRAASTSTPAPRAAVVRMPSEQWLTRASAEIESLPMNERAAAFQKIIEHYKAMRSEERAATQPGSSAQ